VKKPATAAVTPGVAPGLRRYLYLTASVTGAAIMIVEILGARMLAPYVGTSHFVWTAQIAVTLVALAAGYAAGGWLADRRPRLAWLYACLIAGAAYLGLSVICCEQVAYYCLRFRLALGSLLAASILFLPPLALMAMTGPFLVRMLTISLSKVGTSMGRLTSVSTMGSVCGTILIGYVLLPFFSNSSVMWLTSIALVVVAVGYFIGWERKGAPPAVTAGIVALAVGWVGVVQPHDGLSENLVELYRGNSHFGMLQVVENKEADRRFYLNDFLTQNTYDPVRGRSLSLFTYMLHDLAQGYSRKVQDVLCIGLGVGIVPMRFAKEGVRVDAVEINPDVVPLATKYFGFDPAKVNLTIGDGRYFLNSTPRQYDAIVLDAFLGESPPSHLMSREAFASMKARLKPGGALVMNVFGDFEPGRDYFVASVEKTLRSAFRSVHIHAAGNGNVFLVGSEEPDLRLLRPLDYSTMPEAVQEMARTAIQSDLHSDPAHGQVLLDDYNPVDYFDALNREELRKRLALSYRP